MLKTVLPLCARYRSALLPSLVFVGLWVGLLSFMFDEGASLGVFVWWNLLCAVSGLNILAWRLVADKLAHSELHGDPVISSFKRWQFGLCTAFVLGCAFRSAFPRADVQRLSLFDTWLSSVFVGRSVATVAELCFAAQWALWLRQYGRASSSRVAIAVSWFLVPIIVVAEVCSWYGVLTTAYVGNMIEESIWTLAAALIVVSCLTFWRRCGPVGRAYLAAIIVGGAAYVVFMCVVDVPMYAARWLLDETTGRSYLSLSHGLWEASSQWTVTHSWDQWRAEIPWMSLYFSVGVWSSISLVHATEFTSNGDRMRQSSEASRAQIAV